MFYFSLAFSFVLSNVVNGGHEITPAAPWRICDNTGFERVNIVQFSKEMGIYLTRK